MDKYIFRKRKALTKHQCDFFISHFDKLEIDGEIKIYDERRQYFRSTYDINQEVDIKESLVNCLKEYQTKHSFLDSYLIFPQWGVERFFNIQKYDPGKTYSMEHCEHDVRAPFRILAWMIYLNDIKHKGGTYWPQQNFTSIPRAGDLYLWPAGWTHSHHGIPAPKEEKYLASGWISFIKS